MDKNDKKIVIISLICILLTVIFFCIKKQGMFTDEIYTYGLANSYYAPYIADMFDGSLIDKVVSCEDLFNYITVNPNERFSFDSVFYNQSYDTLPPLYYCLVHFISSLFPNTFSKWYGLSLNIVIYICCLIALFKLINIIFENTRISLTIIIFYSLSFIGLSTMLMIRMYVLLTLLTVLLAYYSIRLIEKKNMKCCLIVLLLNYLGMMTHYYYGIYAFLIFIFCLYNLITDKEYKFTLTYFIIYVLGALMFVMTFPAFFDQLLAPKLVSGNTAYSNLFTLSNYSNILFYLISIVNQTILMQFFTVVLVGCFLFQKRKERSNVVNTNSCNKYYNIVVIPAILSLFLTSIISPIVAIRYIYNLIPILCIIVAKELNNLQSLNSGIVELRNKAIIVILLINLIFVFLNPPRYLYSDIHKINNLLKDYSDNPCVFVDNNYSSPLTENLLQLMQFKTFLVTNNIDSKALQDYIQSNPKKDNVVLYIDTNKFFSSGYEAKELLKNIKIKNGYNTHKHLYNNYSVEVYLLTK